MGLIGGVIQPVYCGGSSTLMHRRRSCSGGIVAGDDFSHAATISGGPDFAYDLCARKIPAKSGAT